MSLAVRPEDIDAAADRIAGHVARTPLLRCPRLDERVGGTVLLKAECLQVTGSFKLRGATNAIRSLPEGTKGVVAYSSGNHAQAVALAATRAGYPSVIVMPADAPRAKRDRTAAYGAEVILYDRLKESREAIGEAISEERGFALVPPFDFGPTIAGQGTVGLEAAAQAQAMGFAPDQALVCCSGGGLAAGTGLALKRAFPDSALVTVEPQGFDDTARSLASGERCTNDPGARSICDALLVNGPGALTLPILRSLDASGVAVADDEAVGAVRYAAEELRVVLEPGGAVALAAVLCGRVETKGKVTIVVLSGGNTDMETFAAAMRQGQ
ncbi:threonine ammonia-lyase [Parvularcula dongshanensis]|uniref:Threonine dehydratase n=1 Tax=Parvularcula dongshanensis TaxID=1173995 RepID=A0A840I212_9PROT|nr:threonine/serine dehydratase [Parvularcula dongshanensis]MBB4658100.1 threonine dehydratase [Parvularcula dongshanensis]